MSPPEIIEAYIFPELLNTVYNKITINKVRLTRLTLLCFITNCMYTVESR